MFGHFYNSSIRRYIVLMGELLNGLQVVRERDGNVIYQKVPITYATKERFVMNLNKLNSNMSENPDVARVETILPRCYLSLNDLVYSPMFKTGSDVRNIGKGGSGAKGIRLNPVPYKFIFELGIYTRHETDMLQIVEQILPFFRPNFATKIRELHESITPIERDIQITIQSVMMSEEIDGDTSSRRRLEWTIIFELDGWLYPPMGELKGEIKTIYLDFYANTRELGKTGDFESSDLEVDPRDVDKENWDGSVKVTYSANKPVPTPPEAPGPREI